MFTPGNHRPSHDTHRKLYLHQSKRPFNRRRQTTNPTGTEGTAVSSHAPLQSLPLNCLIAPGFNPLRFTEEMELALEADGGYLDQSYLYWDHYNARAWCELTEQKDYLPEQGFPYHEISRAVAFNLERTFKSDSKNVEFLTIGPGNGKKELQIVQDFLGTVPDTKHVLLNLVDVSQPLLAESYNRSQTIFRGDPRVTTWAIQGSMYNLPAFYPVKSSGLATRPRVVTLIDILHNLPNESLFVQNSLRPMNSGDLLVVLVSNVYASANRKADVLGGDPRLNGSFPKTWEQRVNRLLTGPLERHYLSRLKEISLTPKLDVSSNCLPNSYAINMVADLLLHDGTNKQFVVQRFVRYEPNALVSMFDQLGFDNLDAWNYGKKKEYLVFLLRKR